jgi:arsenate reductase-like glutaredoxin family protein
VSESINEIINFLEKEYKKQKYDIKDRIEKSEIKIKAIQAKKDELVDLKNKINEKIEMFSQKKSPFYEKVVYEKRLNKKELKLSNI